MSIEDLLELILGSACSVAVLMVGQLMVEGFLCVLGKFDEDLLRLFVGGGEFVGVGVWVEGDHELLLSHVVVYHQAYLK